MVFPLNLMAAISCLLPGTITALSFRAIASAWSFVSILDSRQEGAQNPQLPCRLWAKRFRRLRLEIFEHVKKQASEVSHRFLLRVACCTDVRVKESSDEFAACRLNHHRNRPDEFIRLRRQGGDGNHYRFDPSGQFSFDLADFIPDSR